MQALARFACLSGTSATDESDLVVGMPQLASDNEFYRGCTPSCEVKIREPPFEAQSGIFTYLWVVTVDG